MDKVCTNVHCRKITSNGKTPIIQYLIKPESIDNLLGGNVEYFHIHQYGSTVIFLQYLEGYEMNDADIDDYNHQGHVFMLPLKAIDLVQLRDNVIDKIMYNAVVNSDNDGTTPWYKIIIKKDNTNILSIIKNIFKK